MKTHHFLVLIQFCMPILEQELRMLMSFLNPFLLRQQHLFLAKKHFFTKVIENATDELILLPKALVYNGLVPLSFFQNQKKQQPLSPYH